MNWDLLSAVIIYFVLCMYVLSRSGGRQRTLLIAALVAGELGFAVAATRAGQTTGVLAIVLFAAAMVLMVLSMRARVAR